MYIFILTGIGQDSSKPQCKKAKVFRLEKKRKKLEEKGISPDMIKKNEKSKEKTLEDFLQESICDNPVNKLEVTYKFHLYFIY